MQISEYFKFLAPGVRGSFLEFSLGGGGEKAQSPSPNPTPHPPPPPPGEEHQHFDKTQAYIDIIVAFKVAHSFTPFLFYFFQLKLSSD